MSFTHLQVRSGYTLLQSTITIDKLVKKAKELQFGSLALTDESVLYGAIPFYKACKANDIHPILGLIIHVDFPNHGKEPCILLAKTNIGYEQLIKISTYLQQNKIDHIEKETLQTYTDDLIGILPIQLFIFQNTLENVRSYVEAWQSLFAKGDFYLGVEEQDLSHSNIQMLKNIHQVTAIRAVAINDVRYLNKEDHSAFECLESMREDRKWSPSHISNEHKDRHLRSEREMEQLFLEKFPEALTATEAIKNKCNVTFDFNRRLMPSFKTPNHLDAATYLEKCCFDNLPNKYKLVTREITERLKYELKVIQTMDFSDYFLIVADFINYAKSQDIRVGPGRGSAAGSIVAYVLGITDVDPIKYHLLFERFLNPERLTMPDIDVDFSDHRRDEVIDYVRKKYGSEHVTQIITFGTFGVRSILRELFKTMNIDQQDAYFILNEIPSHTHRSIAYYVNQSKELIEYIKQSTKLQQLFTIATKLEGLPRNISTHAAGVIISDQPLIKHIPLTTGANGMNLTQYAMEDLESLGLLKMDFLGLRNLSFLEQIIKSIFLVTGKRIVLEHIPKNDKKTYEVLQKGLTNGIFQLESSGMKQVLKKLKPTSFEDIVAVNALYRPGPMENIPLYIKNKHAAGQINYLHEKLAPILAPTYGVLVYQEQIMQIAHDIAGLSLGEADIFRRIISKKQSEKINEQKTNFISGCEKNGIDKQTAQKIFAWIVKFSNYGFNRSHAVAYSKIAYQLSYLKAHYPMFFFAELLSSLSSQDSSRIYQYIREARQLGIRILAPSINHSFGKYSVENDGLRMGLLSIKGIGQQTVKEILNIRREKEFTSLFDFCLRVSLSIINRKTIELLIVAGAFDLIYTNRASLLASLDQAIDQGELFGGLSNQVSLLPNKYGIKEMYTEIEDFSQMKKLHDEKELLGIYLSDHPLTDYRATLKKQGNVTLSQSREMLGQRSVHSVTIIQSIKKIRTKRGESMVFLTLSDETDDIDAVVFPSLYRKVSKWLKEEETIKISGKVEERNNRLQWVLATLEQFDINEQAQATRQLFIKLTAANSEGALINIKRIASQYPGEVPILIYHETENKTYKLAGQYSITDNNECVQALKEIFGTTNVAIKE